ncbi:hypothetical protein K439DRAFT_1619007 [Ramaria rubella]|nr:hypothetical protein K439DRAFT_1619007 [Ramaria rubella]
MTNPIHIKTAIEKKGCNGLWLKVNQIGPISESIQRMLLLTPMPLQCVALTIGDLGSQDLVVALGMGHIKTGAPARMPLKPITEKLNPGIPENLHPHSRPHHAP